MASIIQNAEGEFYTKVGPREFVFVSSMDLMHIAVFGKQELARHLPRIQAQRPSARAVGLPMADVPPYTAQGVREWAEAVLAREEVASDEEYSLACTIVDPEGEPERRITRTLINLQRSRLTCLALGTQDAPERDDKGFITTRMGEHNRDLPAVPEVLAQPHVCGEWCPLPPEGGYCTRNVGHSGPCAARQTVVTAEHTVAEKAAAWFGVLQECALLLGVPDDEPIPSGVLAAVKKLVSAFPHPMPPMGKPGRWVAVVHARPDGEGWSSHVAPAVRLAPGQTLYIYTPSE